MMLVTAAEMRALDRETIEGGHAAGVDLMERAGAGVVEAMERRYGPLLGLRVLVLAGPGNNGGDGFVAARHLRARGAEPHVGLVGDPARVRGDARAMLDRLADEGLTPAQADGAEALAGLVGSRDHWDYAVDALLGTGARGDPKGAIADAVETLRALDETGTRVVAVDLPSGADADTGAIARRAVRADLTVTFGAPKRGHLLYPARAFAGALEVVDIGLYVGDHDAHPVTLGDEASLAGLVPSRDPRAHKGTVGRVLVIGGSRGLTGSIALASRAALRAGAGYVRAAIPEGVNDILEIKLTEPVTHPQPQTSHGSLARAARDGLLAMAEEVDVVVLGPGLSRDPESADLARALIADCPRPMVVDADALTALAGRTDQLPGAGARVLTPHLGEMSRLTGLPTGEIEAGRIDVAIEWAGKWGVTLVLKGAPTVTAAPDGLATVNPTGNPGMATLGAGDVLSGLIGALIGQGLAPYDAARLGVHLHGAAGDHAARALGQHGIAAGDLVEGLPPAFLQLVRRHDEALKRNHRNRRR